MTIEFINREELSALGDCDVLLKAMGEIKALIEKMGGRAVTRMGTGIPSSIRVEDGRWNSDLQDRFRFPCCTNIFSGRKRRQMNNEEV
jgi:hypothetical protein